MGTERIGLSPNVNGKASQLNTYHYNNNEMEIEAISGYTGDFGSGMLYMVPYLIYGYIEAYDANPNIKRCDFIIMDQENKQKVSMHCLDEWIKPIKYVAENGKKDENGEAAEAAFTYLVLKVIDTAEPKIAPLSDSSGEITNLYETLYKIY
jgi:hypothetical protein